MLGFENRRWQTLPKEVRPGSKQDTWFFLPASNPTFDVTFIILKMGERKSWSQQEDEALRMIKEQNQGLKWNEVAEKLRYHYGIFGRNAKQCRERYHNHLDPRINKAGWSSQDDEKLLKLHCQHGNKWALISRQIGNRTDNCVKNRMHSMLKKAIRALNLLARIFWGRRFKPIHPNIIPKLMGFIEEYRITERENKKHLFQLCQDLKHRIFIENSTNEEHFRNDPGHCEKVRLLLEDIAKFNKNYRRPKKSNKVESDDEDSMEDFAQFSELSYNNNNHKTKQRGKQRKLVKVNTDKLQKQFSNMKDQSSFLTIQTLEKQSRQQQHHQQQLQPSIELDRPQGANISHQNYSSTFLTDFYNTSSSQLQKQSGPSPDNEYYFCQNDLTDGINIYEFYEQEIRNATDHTLLYH